MFKFFKKMVSSDNSSKISDWYNVPNCECPHAYVIPIRKEKINNVTTVTHLICQRCKFIMDVSVYTQPIMAADQSSQISFAHAVGNYVIENLRRESTSPTAPIYNDHASIPTNYKSI